MRPPLCHIEMGFSLHGRRSIEQVSAEHHSNFGYLSNEDVHQRPHAQKEEVQKRAGMMLLSSKGKREAGIRPTTIRVPGSWKWVDPISIPAGREILRGGAPRI